MQTDGSHRGESGVFERYVRTFRKLGNEQTGNTGNFGVDGISCAGTGNTVANIYVGNGLTNADDRTCTAVTQGQGLVEAAADRLHRR